MASERDMSKSKDDIDDVERLEQELDEDLEDIIDEIVDDSSRQTDGDADKSNDDNKNELDEVSYVLEKDEGSEFKSVKVDEIDVDGIGEVKEIEENRKVENVVRTNDEDRWIDLSDIYEKPKEEDKPTEEFKDDEVEEMQQQPSEEPQQDQNYPVITEDGIIFVDYDMVRVHEDDVLKMLRYRLWKIEGFNTLWQDMEVQFLNPLSAIRFARLCRNNGRRVAVVKWRNVYKVFIEVSNPIAYIEFQSYI